MISDSQYAAWLRSNSPKVLLAEIDFYDTVNDEVGTLYISDKGYNTNWSAGVEHRPYPDHIVAVPSAKRSLSNGRASRGELIVDNTGGVRDHWLTQYKFDGRKIAFLYGSPDWEYSDFRLVFIGVVKQRFGRGKNSLVLKFREPEDYLEQPIQSQTLASGPNAGDYVPIIYGDCFNISPVLLDGATHVYQFSDIEATSVSLVKDNGKGPVSHTVDLAAGTVTLTGAPVGNITIDAVGAKVTGTTLVKAGEIIDHIISTRTNLPAEFYDDAAFDALDVEIAWEHNLYVSARKTARQVIDEVLKSIGAKLSRNESGAITVVRLGEPLEVADVTIGVDDIRLDSLVATTTELPWSKARLGYRRNYTVQESLDTTLTATERAELAREYSIVEDENDIAAIHPLATEPELIATTLTTQSGAAERLSAEMALHSVERYFFELQVYAALYQHRLGNTISLVHPRYGFSSGQNCVVYDSDSVFTSGKARLKLWR
ncbi:MAG: hypothetical protein R3332_08295 [Pseudohongiellaceae bacterium]|nr:hypothetical protein [Pseudohongiellaceae bacterium]